ncbi:unnamed protein product [Phytomonas sp. EM1]|nr:unnamed protein product [Phytomonas sp. EM1]|eukprot:CCW61621.1 unnamed protein product [Phytomonas sp. isolate EM1]
MAFKALRDWIDKHLLLTSFVVRIILILYSTIHDEYFRVKYTDIDYMILTDGARAIVDAHKCPFERTTYRYTPLLALLMVPSVVWFDAFGKLLFSLCDLGVLHLCERLLDRYSVRESKLQMLKVFIAFNPVVLNVSTRGNSDMLMTLINLIAMALYDCRRYYAAAGMLGFGAHFKIFPLIYVPSFVFGVWHQLGERTRVGKEGELVDSSASPISQRLQQTAKIALISGIFFSVSFAIPTGVSYFFCGDVYIQEAFLYHFHREDHRHNFSPYWLTIYLNLAARVMHYERQFAPGLWAFIPQAVVLLFTSWRLRRNILQACCTVTILFIAFNKVCTVQYFVWFIPLLPFVFTQQSAFLSAPTESVERSKTSRKGLQKSPKVPGAGHVYTVPSLRVIIIALTLWCSTIPLWVFTAYALEFQGKNHYGRVWLASGVFFLATTLLGGWVGRVSYFSQQNHPFPIKRKYI